MGSNSTNNDINLDEIIRIVQHGSAWRVVQSMIEKGVVSVYENMQDAYKPKKEKVVLLSDLYRKEAALKQLFTELERAPKQLAVLNTFLYLEKTEPVVFQKALLERAGTTAAVLQALCDKTIFRVETVDVDRLSFVYQGDTLTNTLNQEQAQALTSVQLGFEAKKPVLLQGITGSGKTHVYVACIEKIRAQGRQVLFLVPEIALTAQLVRKLRAYLGNGVGIYHSRFNQNERVEVWNKVNSGELSIVIGARSALFLPFNDLGLVIVDEEHDSSYKQNDPAPRYHARDAAIMLAHQNNASVLLGSATPSVETLFNCEHDKYHLVQMVQRFGQALLPAVQVVDMKEATREKQVRGMFSNVLLQAIQETLAQKQQVILFQNRRGYSPFCLCTTCGWVPQCRNCDVSMTFHKSTDQLHCHYCGSRSPYIRICPACGGNHIIAKSFGTEKVEDDIQTLFPNARVQRFDGDTLRNKNKYQEIIKQFEKGQLDILVGTQMVVKGLDFDRVSLVGVLSADGLLASPDFRVNERVFQLLEQVAGRAGRKDIPGRVIIQAYRIDHPVLGWVQHHDYRGFYTAELPVRKAFQYPPYTRLIRCTFRHKKPEVAAEAARDFCAQLPGWSEVALFGPAEPSVARIRNYFLQVVMLKVSRDSRHLGYIKQTLLQQVAMLTAQKKYRQVYITLDVDPM